MGEERIVRIRMSSIPSIGGTVDRDEDDQTMVQTTPPFGLVPEQGKLGPSFSNHTSHRAEWIVAYETRKFLVSSVWIFVAETGSVIPMESARANKRASQSSESLSIVTVLFADRSEEHLPRVERRESFSK